jgi:glycosyltransferase involved in cell wall biosynthesis
VTFVSKPLVSVLTPVYNGERTLHECVESVLSQTYANWDYTIVDNRSTDRTPEIAREYAARDPRIRLIRNETWVRVIENHNIAFRQVSPQSEYCKVVAADDRLLPECLEKMVELAEAHPAVAIVGAYGLRGQKVMFTGLPHGCEVVKGRDVCRAWLLGGPYVFGAPTSVLYRSHIVRSRRAFYNESNLHSDTEACLEFLQDRDFGFLHQILTEQGVQADSLTSYSERFQTYLPGILYLLVKYGPKYLRDDEIVRRVAEQLRRYYRYLGTQVYRRRGPQFWSFHRGKLAEAGHPLSLPRLVLAASAHGLGLLFDPKRSAKGMIRHLRARLAGSPARSVRN